MNYFVILHLQPIFAISCNYIIMCHAMMPLVSTSVFSLVTVEKHSRSIAMPANWPGYFLRQRHTGKNRRLEDEDWKVSLESCLASAPPQSNPKTILGTCPLTNKSSRFWPNVVALPIASGLMCNQVVRSDELWWGTRLATRTVVAPSFITRREDTLPEAD